MTSAAKRVSGWAANLLASGLILVAGLALARQVLEWWQAERTTADAKGQSAGNDRSDLGDPERPHELALGNVPFTLRRETLTGDKSAAFAALRTAGLAVVSKPVETAGKAGPAERRMLSHLGGQKPVKWSAGRWELYQLDGPLLLVAGIQFVAAEDPTQAQRRVVFWGLALPQGADYSENETAWTLFCYTPNKGSSEESPAIVKLVLPSEVRVSLSLATEDGGQVIAFRANGDSAALSRQLEQALAKKGWQQTSAWRQDAESWQGRFEKPGSTADVRWRHETPGELVGVISVTGS